MTITEQFAGVSQERKQLAVAGFVRSNPHQQGIDFYTMMEMIIDADAHLPVIGDVELNQENIDLFVDHLIALGRA